MENNVLLLSDSTSRLKLMACQSQSVLWFLVITIVRV